MRQLTLSRLQPGGLLVSIKPEIIVDLIFNEKKTHLRGVI